MLTQIADSARMAVTRPRMNLEHISTNTACQGPGMQPKRLQQRGAVRRSLGSARLSNFGRIGP